MNRGFRTCLLSAALVLGAFPASPAQERVPVSTELLTPKEQESVAQLLARVEAIRSDAAEKRKAAVAGYFLQLDKLANDLAAAGNLEGVLQVRQERKTWETPDSVVLLDPTDSAIAPAVRVARTKMEDYWGRLKSQEISLLGEVSSEVQATLKQMELFLTKKNRIEAALHIQKIGKSLPSLQADTAGSGTAGKRTFEPIAPKPSYIKGIWVSEYAIHKSQEKDHAWVRPEDMGAPVDQYRIKDISDWKCKEGRNAVARGFIKVETAGTYSFQAKAFYERKLLKVNGEYLYEDDSNVLFKDITLPAGMIPIEATVYIHGRYQMNILWRPPGVTEAVPIPDGLLYYDSNAKKK